ncbi:MAG: hypothetical protein RSA64_07275 [Christensenellaceae bacterium]
MALKENDELIVEGNIENFEIMNQMALRAYEKTLFQAYCSTLVTL